MCRFRCGQPCGGAAHRCIRSCGAAPPDRRACSAGRQSRRGAAGLCARTGDGQCSGVPLGGEPLGSVPAGGRQLPAEPGAAYSRRPVRHGHRFYRRVRRAERPLRQLCRPALRRKRSRRLGVHPESGCGPRCAGALLLRHAGKLADAGADLAPGFCRRAQRDLHRAP